jgi:hypothetical protein
MIGRFNPAGLLAGRPDVQEQAMMARQQPTRQGLLGQTRSTIGGLLGGLRDRVEQGSPDMTWGDRAMIIGAGLRQMGGAGETLMPAQQMIDQRIQGRQAEEQRLAQMEQMQAFRATLPPEQQALYDRNPQGFVDQMTRAEFREPNYQVFGENIFRTDRGLEEVGQVPLGDPDAIRTLRMLQENPDLMAADAARRRAGAAQTNVNVDTGRRETPDQMVRGPMLAATGTRAAQQVTTGLSASRNLVRIGRLEELLADTPQGAEGAIVQIAGNFGIPLTEGASDVQAAAALINSMVPEQRPPGAGPMSDADLELFKQSVPRIINQPGGNRLIIETMRGVANYDIQLGEIARAFEAGQIDLPEYNRRISELNNPIDLFRDQMGNVSGAASGMADMSSDDLFSVLAGGGRR